MVVEVCACVMSVVTHRDGVGNMHCLFNCKQLFCTSKNNNKYTEARAQDAVTSLGAMLIAVIHCDTHTNLSNC